MSTLPPQDDDSLLDSIFSQLKDAMSETGLEDDEEIQEELMEGIKHSLEALLGSSITELSPTVTLVDGGRNEDDPTGDSPRPDLQFVPNLEGHQEEVSFDESNVQLRVFTGSDLHSSSGRRKQGPQNGRIRLDAGEEQSIVHCVTARTQRIHCTEGIMAICFGQEQELCLHKGQSIDVEATIISIKSTDGAKGYFHRVSQ